MSGAPGEFVTAASEEVQWFVWVGHAASMTAHIG